jgi:hypothetical protein
MKPHPSIVIAVLLTLTGAALLRAEEPAKAAPAPDPTTLIVDLRANPPGIFQYGSWKDKLAVTKSGMAVMGTKGAQGDGGFGQNLSERIDLSQASFIEVALGVVPGNEVPRVTIAVNDIDGTQYTAQIAIDQIVPGQPVWMRARREDFKLNSTERGADSLMDWSKIGQWHLQGDWTTKKPLQAIFIALRERR